MNSSAILGFRISTPMSALREMLEKKLGGAAFGHSRRASQLKLTLDAVLVALLFESDGVARMMNDVARDDIRAEILHKDGRVGLIDHRDDVNFGPQLGPLFLEKLAFVNEQSGSQILSSPLKFPLFSDSRRLGRG
jgi:hypothetical protein